MTISGGYASLAFYDSGTADTKRYKPSISYYDAFETSVKYAYTADGVNWSAQHIAGAGNQGLYTSLVYDLTGKANIFFFDRTKLTAKRAKKSGGSWTVTTLLTGGREMQVALKSTGAMAYSTLDEAIPRLDVQYLGS
jgi:threonine dehydrogenase-like Zn-dependent dehydrogenase